MNLLFSNDQRGAYPPSWYAATATPLPAFPALRGKTTADVCIVGGGYTGLSAALHLAEAGMDVVLLEAHRVGFGASGRNGGQLGSGQRVDQTELEATVGRDTARTLWQLGEDAKTLVRGLIARHDIDCQLGQGVAWAASNKRSMDELERYAAHMDQHYDYRLEVFKTPESFRELCNSSAYCGGLLDHGAGHLHPLRLALGLGRAARDAGARLYEASVVHHVQHGAKAVVRTSTGHVEADHLILACNGYLGGLDRKQASRVMPINNFIVATQPLGARAKTVLPHDIAVSDDRFVINYFRLSPDGRLLFGGGESYGYRFPKDIRALVRKPMLEIFPDLADVELDYAWGGTLAITVRRLPYLARLAPNVLTAAGYSGHGVGNAVQAGRLMAEAVRGRSSGFDTFAGLPSTPFPGGPALRSPLLALGMSWYALRDRLGV